MTFPIVAASLCSNPAVRPDNIGRAAAGSKTGLGWAKVLVDVSSDALQNS